MLQTNNVKLNSGPSLCKAIKFAPPLTQSFRKEYSDLEIAIEVVDNVQAAIGHINRYGSHHTDSIITENGKKQEKKSTKLRQVLPKIQILSKLKGGFA